LLPVIAASRTHPLIEMGCSFGSFAKQNEFTYLCAIVFRSHDANLTQFVHGNTCNPGRRLHALGTKHALNQSGLWLEPALLRFACKFACDD